MERSIKHQKDARRCYYYIITNIITGKQYVGRKMHQDDPYLDVRYMGSSKTLKADYRIYGIENFTKVILTYEDFINKETLDARESYFINKFNTLNPIGYNRFDPGKHLGFSIAGTQWTQEQKDKKKEWFKTEYGILFRQKIKDRVSGENSPSKRPEVREKDRLKGQRYAQTEKGKANIRKMVDSKTDEARKRGGQTLKEWYKTPEGQLNLDKKREFFLGENHPLKNPEIRKKHKESLNKPEVKAKISKSSKAYHATERGKELTKIAIEKAHTPKAIAKLIKSTKEYYKTEKGLIRRQQSSERMSGENAPMRNEKNKQKQIESHKAFYQSEKGAVWKKSMSDNNPMKRPEIVAKMIKAKEIKKFNNA